MARQVRGCLASNAQLGEVAGQRRRAVRQNDGGAIIATPRNGTSHVSRQVGWCDVVPLAQNPL